MGKIININDLNEIESINGEGSLVELTQELLLDARTSINSSKSLSFPIAELSTLGGRSIVTYSSI